jgi:sugar phosphate isomerase/epimerase
MLKGIRSTGIICDTMTPNISPNADPANTEWLNTQRVDETLALASANGITRYRIGGGGSYPPNAYGAAITKHLDGWRVNMERLAAINQKYNTQAIFHTQGAIGMALWDLMYVWRNIDPKYVGFNYCVGHVVQNSSATGAASMFANNLRYIFPYLACIALQDFAWRSNADGTFSGGTPQSGKGMVNWVVFFKILRDGGYNGLFDTQEEYQITGADGSNVSMNAAWFADHAVFTSGRMTPALAVAAMKNDMDYYKAAAKDAGWTAAQLTP